eukprot:366286-Chlamydomonas_euryale.AAC.5
MAAEIGPDTAVRDQLLTDGWCCAYFMLKTRSTCPQQSHTAAPTRLPANDQRAPRGTGESTGGRTGWRAFEAGSCSPRLESPAASETATRAEPPGLPIAACTSSRHCDMIHASLRFSADARPWHWPATPASVCNAGVENTAPHAVLGPWS